MLTKVLASATYFRTFSCKKHFTEFYYQEAKEPLICGTRPTGKKHYISESTICWFVKSLKECESVHPQVTMVSVPHKKVSNTIAFRNWWKSYWHDKEKEGIVNFSISIAVAVAVMTASSLTLLKENADITELG